MVRSLVHRCDFNKRRRLKERNKRIIIASLKRFSDVIDDLELSEIPVQGSRCTWRSRPNNGKASKLDAFLFCSARSELDEG